MCIQLHLRLPQVFSIYFAIKNSNLMTNSDLCSALCSNGFIFNTINTFYLFTLIVLIVRTFDLLDDRTSGITLAVCLNRSFGDRDRFSSYWFDNSNSNQIDRNDHNEGNGKQFKIVFFKIIFYSDLLNPGADLVNPGPDQEDWYPNQHFLLE